MRILGLLLLLTTASSCSILKGGSDECKSGSDKCDGNVMVSCVSVKESYNRLRREECPAGNTCVQRDGYVECAAQ